MRIYCVRLTERHTQFCFLFSELSSSPTWRWRANTKFKGQYEVQVCNMTHWNWHILLSVSPFLQIFTNHVNNSAVSTHRKRIGWYKQKTISRERYLIRCHAIFATWVNVKKRKKKLHIFDRLRFYFNNGNYQFTSFFSFWYINLSVRNFDNSSKLCNFFISSIYH